MTEPRPFRPVLREVYARMVHRRWFRWYMVTYIVCLAGWATSVLAGWHGPKELVALVNLWWLPVIATASAEYYRMQPYADWTRPGNKKRHAVWVIGRWVATVIPPLDGQDRRRDNLVG